MAADKPSPSIIGISDDEAEIMRETGRLPRADEFHAAIRAYARFNPAYRDAVDTAKYPDLQPIVRDELQGIFLDLETGKLLPENTIMSNIDIIITSLVARMNQVQALERPKFSPTQAEEAVRTFLKTVQEIICHPLDRQAFGRGEGNINQLVIDPCLITDTLLRNLGLTKLLSEKGTRQAEKVAQRADAIQPIRRMLAHLEPISLHGQEVAELKYFRLMRMSAGDNEGYILGTQVINGQKVLFKTDLHGASRRIQHIEAEYKEEGEVLMKIQKILEDALENTEAWAKIDAADLTDFRGQLILCVEELKHVTDQHKVALRESIQQALSLNQGADQNLDAKPPLKAAIGHVTARVKAMERISQYLALDKVKVDTLINAQMQPVDEFLAKVSSMKQPFPSLEDLEKTCGEQKYEPYLSFGRKFSLQIDRARMALEADDRQNVAREFTKAYTIAKLERAYRDILAVYEDISLHPKSADPKEISKKLKSIHEALKNHDVAPEIKTKEYNPAYKEMYKLLSSLKKRLREITPVQENEQIDFNFDEPIPAQPAPETPRSRIDQLLDRMAQIPGIGKIISEIRELFRLFFQKAKPVPARRPKPKTPPSEPAPEKVVTKEESFVRMKKHVADFDFRAMAENLPGSNLQL